MGIDRHRLRHNPGAVVHEPILLGTISPAPAEHQDLLACMATWSPLITRLFASAVAASTAVGVQGSARADAAAARIAPFGAVGRFLCGLTLVAASVAACGQGPDVVLVNRSAATLAFAPGIVVDPCASAAYQKTALAAAGKDLVERMMSLDENDDFAWVPADAVFVEGGIPGQRIGAPKPMYLVISGAKLPYVENGSIPDGTLPPFGGEPQLFKNLSIPG